MDYDTVAKDEHAWVQVWQKIVSAVRAGLSQSALEGDEDEATAVATKVFAALDTTEHAEQDIASSAVVAAGAEADVEQEEVEHRYITHT